MAYIKVETCDVETLYERGPPLHMQRQWQRQHASKQTPLPPSPSLSSEPSRALARSIINAKKKKKKRNGKKKKILSDRVQRGHKRNAARPFVPQPNAARKHAAASMKGGQGEAELRGREMWPWL